ncbi:MAG TPA: SprT-like domain-containing protein [Solirubrobacterales bacterium]|nr:SprT-like domain-containing protein [Solirubrobacterales bacterium]
MPKLRRRRAQPPAPKPRPRSYYLVAGVPLDEEMDSLRVLPVFADGPLAERRPQLKVRRASTRPNRLGFAVPSEFRLSITAYPGIRPGDVLETLLHELVHLHVGRAKEAHGWHGPTFKRVLGQAMREAYGVAIPIPRATLHGPYAEAIENLFAETAKTRIEPGFLRSRG